MSTTATDGSRAEGRQWDWWAWHLALLLAGGLLGYFVLCYTPLFEPAQPRWIEIAGLVGLALAIAAFVYLVWRKQLCTHVGIRALLTLFSAFVLGVAFGVVMTMPSLLNPLQPEPQQRLSAQLYLPETYLLGSSSAATTSTIKVEGTPDSDSLQLSYSFRDRDTEGQRPNRIWRLTYPANATVQTRCKTLVPMSTRPLISAAADDRPLAVDPHFFYCTEPEAGVAITIRRPFNEDVWAVINHTTRSIAMEVPVNLPPLKILGTTFEPIATSAPSREDVDGGVQPLTPQVTLTSSIDYWNSKWRWSEPTSGAGVPLERGFVFPASAQVTTAGSPVVVSAAMSIPEEAQRLQIYRDLALVILGGAVTFSTVYFSREAFAQGHRDDHQDRLDETQ